jgi:hypothetical protein
MRLVVQVQAVADQLLEFDLEDTTVRTRPTVGTAATLASTVSATFAPIAATLGTAMFAIAAAFTRLPFASTRFLPLGRTTATAFRARTPFASRLALLLASPRGLGSPAGFAACC